eukprot:scaffold48465_cov61-Phaeocystis_antarctica.AAC.1
MPISLCLWRLPRRHAGHRAGCGAAEPRRRGGRVRVERHRWAKRVGGASRGSWVAHQSPHKTRKNLLLAPCVRRRALRR